MMGKETDSRLIVKRKFRGGRTALFEALTNPGNTMKWPFPTKEEGWFVTSEFKASEGEEYSLIVHAPDGTDHQQEGIVKEVIPDRKLFLRKILTPWRIHL